MLGLIFGLLWNAWIAYTILAAPSAVVNEAGFPLKIGCHWTIQRVHDFYQQEGYFISRSVLCWTPPK